MFREVTRFRQKLSEEECIAVLKNTKRGVLSVYGLEGYPYGMPINHYYDEENGKIYFHGGMVGHKIDALKENDKVSFCVMSDPIDVEGQWYKDFDSVIVFGRAKPCDHETMIRISTALSRKFTDDEGYIETEIRNVGARTLAYEITVDHMSGKHVHER